MDERRAKGKQVLKLREPVALKNVLLVCEMD